MHIRSCLAHILVEEYRFDEAREDCLLFADADVPRYSLLFSQAEQVPLTLILQHLHSFFFFDFVTLCQHFVHFFRPGLAVEEFGKLRAFDALHLNIFQNFLIEVTV